jgi:hypothetical protein
MTNFEKEYVITQEEIAAKDGTGKKYFKLTNFIDMDVPDVWLKKDLLQK